MSEQTPPTEYRSNDMGCVTFLNVQGHPSQRTEFEGSTCYWIFLATAALLRDLEAYQEGTALVDPREYNKRYAEVKRQFFSAKA